MATRAPVVSSGPDAQNRYITTYFRRAFVVSNPSAFSALNLWLVRDDGGVVYLNGVEVLRSPNMPAGPIAYNTLTVGNAPPDNTVDQAAVSPSLLVAGTNVIAVEIHQQSPSSSDLSFECALVGVVGGLAPPPAFAEASPAPASSPSPLATTTNATVSLGGRANVIDTRAVRVNGEEAQWTAWQGLWRGQATLEPGMNRVWVQAFDTNLTEIARTYLDLFYNTGTSQIVAGAVSGPMTWRAADGPYYVTADLTVGDGATLTIEPGTAVYFAPATGLTVSGTGRLLAEGTDRRPIRFTRQPGASGTWAGITLSGATSETRLSYVDIQYAGSSGRCIQATDSVLLLDHATFTNVNVQYLTLDNSSFQCATRSSPA